MRIASTAELSQHEPPTPAIAVCQRCVRATVQGDVQGWEGTPQQVRAVAISWLEGAVACPENVS